MGTLDEKKRLLQKAGFSLFEKKMLRQILANLGSISLHLNCNIRSCIVNLSIPNPEDKDNYKVYVIITNTENKNSADMTATAKDMKDDNPLFDDLSSKIFDILQDCAKFWNTPETNIVFQCWTAKNEDKVLTQIKPKEGFPETEFLTI